MVHGISMNEKGCWSALPVLEEITRMLLEKRDRGNKEEKKEILKMALQKDEIFVRIWEI
uniref:Uncharacterized protein n=1 Tax=Rhizophagus irregularis (strain DAOM 181602 / DAOM 197198 / MUCL 43194) TaxID=747089 RepID=U9TQ80_RHIID